MPAVPAESLVSGSTLCGTPWGPADPSATATGAPTTVGVIVDDTVAAAVSATE